MSTKSYDERFLYTKYKTNFGYDQNGNQTPESTTFTTTSLNGGGTRTGISNPSWRAQIASGACATTPLTASKLTGRVTASPFHLRTQHNTNPLIRSEYFGMWCPNFNSPSTSFEDVEKADNAALMDYYKKLRNKQRSIQSGVVIGELLETIHMIRHAALTGRKLAGKYIKDVSLVETKRGLRSGPMRKSKYKPKNIMNRIGDLWLEFAFGWTPTVSDVQKGAEALARIHLKAEKLTLPVSAWAVRTSRASPATGTSTIPGSPLRLLTFTSETREAKVKYYGRVKVGVPGTPNVNAAAILGLTISDFVPTLYELVPYTWLIDYFSNLGDVIDALCFPRSDIVWTTRTQRQRIERKVMMTLDYARTNDAIGLTHHLQDVRFGCATTVSERSQMSRAKLSSVPIPSLQFELPFPNLWKDLNLAALYAARNRAQR
jgi:hypothetical protein